MDVYDSKVQSRLAPKDGSLDVLAERVDELKSKFKAEYEKNSELYDKLDYDRFMDKNDDWYARRWIIYQRDVPTAFEMLKDTMKWRKEMDLNNMSYEDFPREFFECGCTFEYGHDKRGKFDLYSQLMRMHQTEPESNWISPKSSSIFKRYRPSCDVYQMSAFQANGRAH